MPAILYLVSTPIGNLEDITFRAVRILKEASLIACEDTRQTRKLLDHYGISKPVVSYHEHNEAARTAELIRQLEGGVSVALVSDAGTPLISDPGYRLVTAAVAAGIKVVPIPGPSAALGALAASGLPTDSFRFCGFLPHKQNQRRKMLEVLSDEDCTLIFYEAPHRILETLDDIGAAFGDRPVVIARELTKLHEEFLRGSARELRVQIAGRPSIKGEITVLIAPRRPAATSAEQAEEEVRGLERAGMSRMDAVKQVAKSSGLPKRDLYRRLLKD